MMIESPNDTRKIIEYITIYKFQDSKEKFDILINARIKEGWVPLGAPIMNEHFICQAMVRYENETEEAIRKMNKNLEGAI